MNAHATTFAEAIPVDAMDRAVMRRALQAVYADNLATSDRIDARIDDIQTEVLALQQEMNGLALERSDAHRNVVRAAAQLAALEAGEGR